MAKKLYAAVPLTLTKAPDIKDHPGRKPELAVGDEFKVQPGYTAEDLADLEKQGLLATKAEVTEEKPAT